MRSPLSFAPTLVFSSMAERWLYQYRVLWLGGNLGGGKTLLAYAFARHMVELQRAYYICSNVKSVWNDKPSTVLENAQPGQVDKQFLNAVFILDEAGTFIDSPREAKTFNAALRKMESFLILASVEPPPSRMKFLTGYRMMNLMAFGIPVWIYEVALFTGQATRSTQKRTCKFALINPSQYYGIYDTLGFPSEAKAIKKALKIQLDRISRVDDDEDIEDYDTPPTEEPSANPDDDLELERIAEGIADATDDLQDTISVLQHQRRRQTRRKRF